MANDDVRDINSDWVLAYKQMKFKRLQHSSDICMTYLHMCNMYNTD